MFASHSAIDLSGARKHGALPSASPAAKRRQGERYRQRLGRPSVPRNEAMRAARGRYIALLDADDVSTEHRSACSYDLRSASVK